MNPDAMKLAEARFQAALTPEASETPPALHRSLAQLCGTPQSQSFEFEHIDHITGELFPFLSEMYATGRPPDSTDAAKWEAVIRRLLKALRCWDASAANSFNQLCALLHAIAAVDANMAGISSIAAQIASSQLMAGLRLVIEDHKFDSLFNEPDFPEQYRQVEALACSGDLEHLGQIISHVSVFPPLDLWTAVVFMYNADPNELAVIIEQKNNIFLSIIVCNVLETHAVTFANHVNNILFKFVSVAKAREKRLDISQKSLQNLLLQVAKTSSVDWASWMRALFKAPGDNASLEAALASIIQHLSKKQWTAFFKALSLKHSETTAASIEKILTPFSSVANPEEKNLMWETAYEIWSDWNYGKDERDNAMFDPAACALDFPVAMYYASLPSYKRLAEESRLLEAIETIEEQWFDSVTELVTERNRLRSRLRLVQHGTLLTSGGRQSLPPPIQPEVDLYFRSRY